jgi:hypothetical protein
VQRTNKQTNTKIDMSLQKLQKKKKIHFRDKFDGRVQWARCKINLKNNNDKCYLPLLKGELGKFSIF